MTSSAKIWTLLLLSSLPLAARAADVTDPFEEFWARHERAGTLISEAPLEARQRGWEPAFRNAVITRFHGWAGLGLELTVSPDPRNPPRAGSTAVLRFIVANRSNGDRQIVTGGSCHTVHTARLNVFQPDGRVEMGLGRPPGGGGHCFCTQRENVLKPGESVELERNPRADATLQWRPARPGRYYVVGQYSTAASISYSVPTPIDVE